MIGVTQVGTQLLTISHSYKTHFDAPAADDIRIRLDKEESANIERFLFKPQCCQLFSMLHFH